MYDNAAPWSSKIPFSFPQLTASSPKRKMNRAITTTTESPAIDLEVAADEEAVIASFLTGRPLDPEVARRVHERAQSIRDRVFRQHGLVDISVPAIRELRGELPGSISSIRRSRSSGS